MALERLSCRDDGMVHYQGDKFQPGLGVVLAAISSPAHDETIEKILKHRNERAEAELAQDEAWLHHRPARGPPRPLELLEDFEETKVPTCNAADDNQDAPGQWWLE